MSWYPSQDIVSVPTLPNFVLYISCCAVQPTSIKELKSFLGLCSYFQHFICSFVAILLFFAILCCHSSFLTKLAYLCDLFKHLYHLNSSMLGIGTNVSSR